MGIQFQTRKKRGIRLLTEPGPADQAQVHDCLAQMYEMYELVEKMQPMIKRAAQPAQHAIL